tara:strand:+ start:5681 stop:5839 length:159 start_codon:yes stop_codon:yes gene_type:complete
VQLRIAMSDFVNVLIEGPHEKQANAKKKTLKTWGIGFQGKTAGLKGGGPSGH